MDFQITNDVVEIEPKTKYLRGSELILLRNKDIGISSAGLKKTVPKDAEEEVKELEKLYDCLEQQLSRSHIERLGGRTLAEWDHKTQAVRVIRKDGKFENFGFNKHGQHYLEYYEALFLLEKNRLQLEYNSCVASIEQSYLLLIGEKHSQRCDEYLVYSVMTRSGYILNKYENRPKAHSHRKQEIRSREDCIWHILEMEIEQEKKSQKEQIVPDYVRNYVDYTKIRHQFQQIKETIKTPEKGTQNIVCNDEYSENDLDFRKKMETNLKRPAQDDNDCNYWHKIKRNCTLSTPATTTANTPNESLIDFLKSDAEYERFRETFHKLNIIPLKSYDTENEEAKDDSSIEILPINFDVYLHNEGYRKSSPGSPQFRIVIFPKDAAMQLSLEFAPFRADYLEYISATSTLDRTRREYDELSKMPPPCLELHRKMADVESKALSVFRVDKSRWRKCYENATHYFGKTNSPVWIDYIKFERDQGDPKNMAHLYERAKSTLDKQLVDNFMTEFTLLKAII